MSARPDPAGGLTARVLLGTSRVEFKVPGEPTATFDEPTLTWLFRRGLLLGRRRSSNDTAHLGQLRTRGHVRFLVGRADIGTHAGLRAVRDGLEHAVHTGVHDLEHPPPAATAADDAQHPRGSPADDSVAADGAAPGQPPQWLLGTSIAVEDLQPDFDAWLSRAEHETPITLTRNDRPVAAMVAWEWYRGARTRLARIEAAYWMAWVGGRFDPAQFVELTDEQITPAGELSTRPSSS